MSLRFFHSEDKDRIDSAVEAALNQVREKLKDVLPKLAKMSVEEAATEYIARAGLMSVEDIGRLSEEDLAKIAMISALVKVGVEPNHAMDRIFGPPWQEQQAYGGQLMSADVAAQNRANDAYGRSR